MNAEMLIPGLMALVMVGVQLVMMFGAAYFGARLAIRHERRASN